MTFGFVAAAVLGPLVLVLGAVAALRPLMGDNAYKALALLAIAAATLVNLWLILG